MKFLTTGEKVKTTRKFLKMNQEDLADDNISRGLISMIEIGQRNLNKDTAQVIIKKFKERSEKLGFELNIDEDYLLRSPGEDAELYCLKKLEKLNTDKDIQDIFEIAYKFSLLNVEAAAYSKLGEYFFNKKKYDEAFINYNNAIEILRDIKKNNELPHLYLQLGYCKVQTLQYADALSFFIFSQRYSLMYNDKDTEKKSTYDISKCYILMNKIDLGLEMVKKFLALCNKEEEFNEYIYAKILEASCYETKEKYDNAIDIYNSLLTEKIDCNNPVLGYIYNNLGLNYLNKDDYKKSLEYFSVAEELRSKVDPVYLSHTLIEESCVFSKQARYKDAVKLIKEGLKQAGANNDFEYLLKGNYELIHIYEALNDTLSLKKAYLKIADYLTELNRYSELILAYTKLSILYLNEANINEAKKFLLMSLEISRKCCNNVV